jgi:catechol 2,3-dioxygenase-like lactoylglutathione lyase family enzyme
MFDHVTIRVSDRAASERFYDTVLAPLGIERSGATAEFVEWDDFSLAAATPERPVTRGLHVGFAAPSRAEVDELWQVGTAAGYRDDGAPGPRPEYGDDYYGAFLLDPDGNSAEAVHHDRVTPGHAIDHVWVRVAGVAASRRFYELVAPHAGFEVVFESPERVRFAGARGSFSVVAGEQPSEHVHIAFPAREHATVDAFHRAAVAAGYRDAGAPNERPQYHPGYYGAFVLDPDGNVVEVVNHDR